MTIASKADPYEEIHRVTTLLSLYPANRRNTVCFPSRDNETCIIVMSRAALECLSMVSSCSEMSLTERETKGERTKITRGYNLTNPCRSLARKEERDMSLATKSHGASTHSPTKYHHYWLWIWSHTNCRRHRSGSLEVSVVSSGGLPCGSVSDLFLKTKCQCSPLW